MDPIENRTLPSVHNLDTFTARNSDEATALRSFDAYFVGEMLKRSVPENPSGLFDGGEAGRMYQEQLYQEFARLIAEKGDFGIARSLEGTLAPDGEESAETSPSLGSQESVDSDRRALEALESKRQEGRKE